MLSFFLILLIIGNAAMALLALILATDPHATRDERIGTLVASGVGALLNFACWAVVVLMREGMFR